jgi:hypothetical protein
LSGTRGAHLRSGNWRNQGQPFDDDPRAVRPSLVHLHAGTAGTATVRSGVPKVPRIRLAGLAACHIDETCRPGPPCPAAQPPRPATISFDCWAAPAAAPGRTMCRSPARRCAASYKVEPETTAPAFYRLPTASISAAPWCAPAMRCGGTAMAGGACVVKQGIRRASGLNIHLSTCGRPLFSQGCRSAGERGAG